MRNSLNHEKVFFDFVKNHDILQHISYSENIITNQKIIGLQVDGLPGEDNEIFVPYVQELLKQTDVVIIDPNYDEIYNNFIKLGHNEDSIEYIKNLFDDAETKEELLHLIINLIIKPLIECNINAKKVYFRVKPYWNTEWCDQVIEVQ
jgi:hypothetical protein